MKALQNLKFLKEMKMNNPLKIKFYRKEQNI
jgi:hypothetical protein